VGFIVFLSGLFMKNWWFFWLVQWH